MISKGERKANYMQANYYAKKYYRVEIWQLPDLIRRHLITWVRYIEPIMGAK